MKKSFASDNNSGVHPEILKAIERANSEHFISYGDDPYTTEAKKLFKEVFGETTETFFFLTGTGSNVSALQAFTNRFQAIICPETAHINVDECGAVEHALGVKLLDVETIEGKLTREKIEKYLHFIGDQHHVQPKILSITQATELGTVYSLKELENLIDFAHKNDLKVHIDGARIANAAVKLNCSLRSLTTDLGIDVLSLGGTKNGMMVGEAVVLFNKSDIDNMPFIRKQNMQLISKMRFISAQFIPYFKDNLWYNNAKQANEMALLLYEKLFSVVPEILVSKPEANALFVKLPKAIASKMQKERFFYTWDETEGIYRFMTSFDMVDDDINDFVGFVISHVN
ncbi:MAG: low specificity L-threonine aldolase [Candidatus Cloacimonetes bacterium]|nr:low specificity L-threonine aldolase [Candidatus Cloacimonadota bacterium]